MAKKLFLYQNLNPKSRKLYAIGHDATTNTLGVQFRNKDSEPTSIYHYANFTADDFATFKAAESLGSYFIKNIQKEPIKFPYVKIS